jgi:hypothetical protein
MCQPIRGPVSFFAVAAIVVFEMIAIPARAQSLHPIESQVQRESGVRESWMADAQENIRRKEYEVTRQKQIHAPDLPPSWHAANRANDLRTFFTEDGIVVVRRTDPAPSWSWGLRLREAAAVPPSASGNRIEYARPDLTEWYVNDERGLEQGFTVPRATPRLVGSDGRLRLVLDLVGNMKSRRAGNGAIELLTPNGASPTATKRHSSKSRPQSRMTILHRTSRSA